MIKFKFISLKNEKYPDFNDKLVQTGKPNKHTLRVQLITNEEIAINGVKDINLYLCVNDETSYDVASITDYTIINNSLLDVIFYIDYLEDLDINKLRLNFYLNVDTYITELYPIKTLASKTSSVGLKVTKRPLPELSSNMPNFLLDNSKQFVPNWSKAYQNTVSNFAKILEPCYNTITGFYSTMHRNLLNSYKTFDFPTTTISLRKKPIKIIDQANNVYLDTFCIENAPKKLVSFEPQVQKQFIELSYNPLESFKAVELIEPTILYIKKEIKNNEATITIAGLNENGRYVSEIIFLTQSSYKPTINKYKIILKIDTTASLQISNYINCIKDHQYTTVTSIPVPPFVLKENNFNFYVPDFRLEQTESKLNSVLSLYSGNTLKYYFCFDHYVTSLFVDPYLNLHWTTATAEYRISSLSNFISTTYNNVNDGVNNYIYTEDQPYLNEWVDIIVDIPHLLLDYPDLNIATVALEVEGESIKYLDEATEQFQANKKTLNLKTILNKLTISVKITNFKEHIFKILVENNTFINTIKVPCIYNTNSYTIPANTTLIVEDDQLKLFTNNSEQVSFDFLTDLDLTNKLYVFFTWNDANNLDYRITIGADVITNELITADEDICTRVFYDGNTFAEGFYLDIEKAKTTYNLTDLVFNVSTRYRQDSNYDLTKSTSNVLFFSKDINQIFNLTSKDSDLNEYEFILQNNQIIGNINANY